MYSDIHLSEFYTRRSKIRICNEMKCDDSMK